ncbi:MAG: hypothetical protein ACLTJG_12725, partial [[Clostridium] innocuum]
MPLSGISSLFQRKILCGRIYEEEEMEQKERKYELVIAVVEHGWRDQVMEAAKEANATGGTVLHARSLHEDDATSFLGIRLQGEKDIVVILSVYENYKQIMHEINMAAGLQAEAKGLIFSCRWMNSSECKLKKLRSCRINAGLFCIMMKRVNADPFSSCFNVVISAPQR